MAAILNLRNNPAYKESSLLGHQEPERGKFFPIPMDFTRNSVAWIDGQEVPANLLTYSNDFTNAAWTKSTGVTITPNAGISPDGTNNASRLTRVSSGNVEQLVGVISGKTYPLSVSVKKEAGTVVKLTTTSAFPATSVDFDLENKTITPSTGTPLSSGIIDEGNDWYRCYFTQTASSTSSGALRITTNDNSSVLIYNASLNEGTEVKKSPITTDRLNVPRVDSEGRIIVEPQRTNILTYSNDFSNSDWLKTGIGNGLAPVVTPNAAISPDGTMNATRVVFDCVGTAAGDRSILRQLFPSALTTIGMNTFYVKSADGNTYNISGYTGGTVGDFEVNDEWQRIQFSSSNAGSNYSGLENRGDRTTGTFADILIYGGQVEDVDNYPTSYIPTQSSAVTRSADSSLTTGIGSYIPSEVGTVRWEGLYNGNTGLQNLWQVDDGTALNKYEMKVNTATGRITFIGFNNGAPSWILNTPEGVMSTDTMHVVDATFSSANGAEIFVDGISRGTFTANPVANGVMSNLRFSTETGADTFKGRLSSLTMFDEILTPAQTASLI
jgi:hypothetical protein